MMIVVLAWRYFTSLTTQRVLASQNYALVGLGTSKFVALKGEGIRQQCCRVCANHGVCNLQRAPKDWLIEPREDLVHIPLALFVRKALDHL